MACQCTSEDNNRRHQQQTETDTGYRTNGSNNNGQPSIAPPRRVVSRPIPIPRRKTNDDTDCDNQKISQSLPAHFLKAPRLGSSVPNTQQPTPFLLSTEDVTVASTPYGSLRDSQHFMVGSFRDNTFPVAASAPTQGIRIDRHRGGGGSLSALMQQREEEDMSEDEASPILSSSLTGLEILRRGQHYQPVVPRSFSEPRPPIGFLLPPPAHRSMQNGQPEQVLFYPPEIDDEDADEPFQLDL